MVIKRHIVNGTVLHHTKHKASFLMKTVRCNTSMDDYIFALFWCAIIMIRLNVMCVRSSYMVYIWGIQYYARVCVKSVEARKR